MPKAYLIRFCCISFLIGIFAASTVLDRPWVILVLQYSVIIGALSMLCWILRPRFFIILFLAAFAFGVSYVILWYYPYLDRPQTDASSMHYGEIIFVEPAVDKQRLIVQLAKPDALQGTSIMVYTSRYPLLFVGTHISFPCILQKPEPYEGFAYDKYTALKGVLYVCFNPPISTERAGGGLRRILFSIKEYYSRDYNRAFHEPENSLIQAMVLARTGELPRSMLQDFSRSGLSHIISISGLHITLLIVVVETLLAGCGLDLKRRFVFVSLGLLLYLILLGFPPPAVRSAIMGIICIGARLAGRPIHGLHVLLLVATGMVLQNPLVLSYDIGFQLSFTAMAGIMSLTNYWVKIFFFIPERFGLRNVISLTFAAQTVTWPLTSYYFHSVSLIAPLTNIVVISLLAPVLILAFAMPLVASVPIVHSLLQWPLFFSLKAMVTVASLGAHIPYAYAAFSSFSLFQAVGAYGLMAILFFVFKRFYHNTDPEGRAGMIV